MTSCKAHGGIDGKTRILQALSAGPLNTFQLKTRLPKVSSLSSLITQLEAEGKVTRKRDPADGRYCIIALVEHAEDISDFKKGYGPPVCNPAMVSWRNPKLIRENTQKNGE